VTANVSNRVVLHFGPFDFEVDTGELRRDGARIRLQPQPARVLALLAARPGELVTREQIQQQVWSGETFVDFEHGVNFCIREIRAALGDSSREPRYIETLPRRGYRFVAPVETRSGADQDRAPDPPLVSAAADLASSPAGATEVPAVGVDSSRPGGRRAFAWGLGVPLLLVLLVLALGFVVMRPTGQRSPAVGTPDPAAREAYLAGRYLWNKGTGEALTRSLEQFERATALDPDYAPAYAGLADSYRLLAMNGALPAREASEKAKTAALRALEIDPRLAEARVSLGSILFRYEWDWDGAEREFRRAIAEAPGYGLGHHDYAWFLVSMGRFDEAVAEIKVARDLDPLSPVANADVGWVYLRARRYDEAIAAMERTLEIEPDFSAAQACLEMAYVYKGMYAQGRDAARRHLEELGADPAVLSEMASLAPAEGLRRSWQWKLERRIADARKRPVTSYPFAMIYAALGDRDLAFQWLERAFAERDPMLVALNVDPAFDGLRSDQRFADLIKRIGLGV
jgi:DNA-binding winged helix-turn-helix (wHTH) protein/Tfp pilus assembly protein PilF